MAEKVEPKCPVPPIYGFSTIATSEGVEGPEKLRTVREVITWFVLFLGGFVIFLNYVAKVAVYLCS